MRIRFSKLMTRGVILSTILTLVLLLRDLSLTFYINNLTSNYYLLPKNPQETYPAITLPQIRNNVSYAIFNTFRGYKDYESTNDEHPPDPQFFQKIIQAKNFFKHPLFTLRKNGIEFQRHPWKFEKIIHQTWMSEDIPMRTVPWVQSWLMKNPDWTYMFWTDETSRLFLQEYFPSLLPVYDSWTAPIQRADMFRYIALYAFGGVYADLDMEDLRPLDDVRDWSSCILSREPELQTFIMSNFMNCFANNWTFTCNAFMACRSHHPFMLYTIIEVAKQSPLISNQACPLNTTISCTGPFRMSFAYGFYRRSIDDVTRTKRRDWDVICPRYELFLPTFDETRYFMVRQGCRRRQLTRKQSRVCDVYRRRGEKNLPAEYSYTTHHWFHSYHYDVNKDVVNIGSVTRILTYDRSTIQKYFQVQYIPASADI